MRPDGGFSDPTRVDWERGRFVAAPGRVRSGEPADAPRTDPREARLTDPAEARQTDPADAPRTDPRWLIPGLVDAHLHASWQAFDAADRDRLTPEQTRHSAARTLAATLAAGFTSVRDAGGMTPEMLGSSEPRPRVQLSVAILDRRTADAAGGLPAAVDDVLARGARWVKLAATGGVSSDSEAVFTRAQMADAVSRAAGSGAGVMVHAWGGPAIDDAIEAGAMSIEHGIFLTAAQASRAAAAGLSFVPTLRIYRLVQRMIARGTLPKALRSRVDEAVGAHPEAVRRARDSGLPIVLGTDFGTAEQHGDNRREFDELVDAGLTPREALVAATRAGAELLARVADGDAPSGRIAPGEAADAVILRVDPRVPGALSAPDAIAEVIVAGIRFPAPPRSPRLPVPRRTAPLHRLERTDP